MSLLIVRCPLKPYSGSLTSSPSDWQDLACAEHFDWCLLDDLALAPLGASDTPWQLGQGTTDSMPYADEALILMPTLDVRLIEAKVPLANAKKLQQILPNLVEEYLLGGAESIAVQAFPPIPGKLALHRTLAIIDRAWYGWLTQQLEGLLCQRVRLIPDCLLLSFDTLSTAPSLAYMREGENIIFTKRTGEQLGVAWVERDNLEKALQLPQAIASDQMIEFAWDWLAPSAHIFLQENASSKSANFALNLLPKTFKRLNTKSGFAHFTSHLSQKYAQRDRSKSTIPSRLTWTDPVTWREPTRWAAYLFGAVLLGFTLHLSWLVFDNWRWANQMNLLAAQSLTSASMSALTKNTSATDAPSALLPTTVTGAFIKQVTLEQRRQGLVTDADFAPMAAKLQQLKSIFGGQVLQQIEYDGYGIEFEFLPSSVQTPAQVTKAARTLGLIVKPLGKQRYRLEPYAGLGVGS